MTLSACRPLFWCLLLLCVAGVQVVGLDEGGGSGRGAGSGGGGGEKGSGLVLGYEGGADEAGMPQGAMPLGLVNAVAVLARRGDGEFLSVCRVTPAGAGRRVWLATSRAPPAGVLFS